MISLAHAFIIFLLLSAVACTGSAQEEETTTIELYNTTVNLTAGNFTFTQENDTQTYTIDNLTDFGALNATGLDFNVSVMRNLTGDITADNATDNMSNASFMLEGIENITNNNSTGEMWFIYINGVPAEEDFGMNNVSDGDNLSFWYTTEEGGEAAIEHATYVANITVATEEGMELQPGQNLTVLYSDTVNLTAGNFTFTPENRTQSYTVYNFTDIGALNATGLEYNVSLQGVNFTNMTNMSMLQGIEGIRNNNTTGERWFVYINETQAQEDFGMNPVSNGTNLKFWYATEENGEAATENATYLVNITVAIEEREEPSEGNDIIDTAAEDGNFTILLTAIEAANLTDTLRGEGPFTVFAPTDEAFNALPNGTIEALLNDTDALTNILLYHVAGEKLMAEDVVNMTNITTLQGSELPVNVTDEGVFIGDAEIIVQDVNASNGVIHIIDSVLIPEEGMETQPGQNLTVLYNDTVNLTAGNFTFTPENSTQNYTVNNFTDIGALNATGLEYNVSLQGVNFTNMTNMSILQGIEGIRNNNTTGERWFVYINGTQAQEDFGMNPVTDGTNLSFWYTTQEGGEASIENATYVANITVAAEGEIEPQPDQNLTVLYNDTVNLTAGNVVFRPGTTLNYTIDNLTDFGALYATGLNFTASLTQNMTGNATGNMTNVSFILKSIEEVENNNSTGEMWFVYINGEPTQEDLGMNNVSDGDNLSFWYTTQEGGEASIENATYVANITVAVEEGMEPQPEQNLTVLYSDTVNLTAGNFTFTPENSTQNYTVDNFTDIGALNATGLQYNVSIVQNGNATNETNATNMTNMSVLEGIESIRNNNTTGERWFVYINGTQAEEDFGMNPVTNGTNLSFWYTTEENGEAAVENATYVANVTVAIEEIEEEMEPGPEPGQNLTELYNDTVNLTAGNFTFTPENDTQSYEIDNLTDFGALNATGLQYNVSVLRALTGGNTTGNVTDSTTEVAFVLDGIAGIENDNTTGEMWFTYINGEPAEQIFGMNNISDGDNLSFWYTTQEGREVSVENATYVAIITVAEEAEMEPQPAPEPGQNQDNTL